MLALVGRYQTCSIHRNDLRLPERNTPTTIFILEIQLVVYFPLIIPHPYPIEKREKNLRLIYVMKIHYRAFNLPGNYKK